MIQVPDGEGETRSPEKWPWMRKSSSGARAAAFERSPARWAVMAASVVGVVLSIQTACLAFGDVDGDRGRDMPFELGGDAVFAGVNKDFGRIGLFFER
jgi:hypothetical protein